MTEQKIMIRKRKSAKHGETYEYRFETAPIGEKRKWSGKGGFSDETAARLAGIRALEEYNTCGYTVKPATMSVADFLERWIENDCVADLKEITVENYRKKIKNLILPYLGKYRLNTVDRDKLQSLLMILHDKGYSGNTLCSIKGILTKCFQYAYYSGYLTRSPAVRLKIPRNENTSVPTRRSPHVYLTKEELDVIFKRFPPGHPSYLPLMLGLHCGLRSGEAFALTWDDIDLEGKKISVNKQIQWRQFGRTDEKKKAGNGRKSEDCGCWYFSSTKYKSDRVIETGEELFRLLSAEKAKQEEARSRMGDRFTRYYETGRREITQNPTAKEIRFVCVRENGTYITSRTMQHTSRIVHYELKIKDFDYHSLRHTHATVLLEKGAPLKYIQQRLGHKKIDITVNVYQHLTEELRKRGKEILDEIYSS